MSNTAAGKTARPRSFGAGGTLVRTTMCITDESKTTRPLCFGIEAGLPTGASLLAGMGVSEVHTCFLSSAKSSSEYLSCCHQLAHCSS